MMSRVASVLMISGLVACGFPGAGDDDDASPLCPQIVARLQLKLSTADRSCTQPGECLRVGNGVDTGGFPTCNETISFASNCAGDAVNTAAWSADPEARDLERQWFERCVPLGSASGVTSSFDCAPADVSCDQQRCRATPRSCFVDAGVQ